MAALRALTFNVGAAPSNTLACTTFWGKKTICKRWGWGVPALNLHLRVPFMKTSQVKV